MFSGVGSILMLHRTAPYEEGKIVYNENMKISSEELDLLIRELKHDKRAFLCLDEVVQMIQTGKKPKSKFVVFTLDDGYSDNLKYGYPVFKDHNVPFCIYLTNSFPNQTTNLWWYALENLILDNHTLRLLSGRKLENNNNSKKEKNFLMLRSLVINEHFRDPLSYFRQLGELRFDLSNERKNNCLTWDDIISLSKDGLATIGCHTVNHYPLSKLDHHEIRFEILASKQEIESKLNQQVKHFAFPFGSRNEASTREYEAAKSIGFNSIVTTLHGHIHLSDNPQKLDRIFLSPIKKNPSLLRRKMFWGLKSAVSKIKSTFEFHQ